MQAKSAPTAVPNRNTRAFVSKYKSAIIVMIGSFILAVILGVKAGPSSLFNTLVTGGMWALMAVGLSLVFGVMNVAHFAHGESFMVGAFIGYFVFTPISKYLKTSPNEFLSLIAPFAGIIVAALAGLVLGYLLERLLFRPLRGRGKSGWVMNTFLVTVGLSFVMINGTTLLLGPEAILPAQRIVLRLAERLSVPLRERNPMLEAAGYAQPVDCRRQKGVNQSFLDSPELTAQSCQYSLLGEAGVIAICPVLKDHKDRCRVGRNR